ncbi:MAG: alpha/beta fold hydrolase [Luteimonas sp.]
MEQDHQPRRVILLHGLWMPAASMHWLASQLQAQGFAPETFAYHSIADGPDLAVPRLVELLRAGDEVDIVAHSLGGLIALQALCETPALPVARVVCMGSPLTGSGAATGMLRWAPAASLLGRSASLLQQGVQCWRGNTQVGVIAGRVQHGLGALFAAFDSDHDGTVAVAETKLEGIADHIVVDASHSGLLFSAAAASQVVAFLRHGHFDHPTEQAGTR